MNLQELKELIEQLEAENDDNDEFDLSEIEVRYAAQPSWAMAYAVEAPDAFTVFTEHESEYGAYTKPVVYLAEGRQLGYLPDIVCNIVW